jgi:hypothetical protein
MWIGLARGHLYATITFATITSEAHVGDAHWDVVDFLGD